MAAGKGKSAEEKLKAYIRVHSEAILTMTGPRPLHLLINREMQEPTLGLDAVVDRTMKPRFDYLFSVVAEILDLPADDERVTLSALSIHGLIIMFRPNPLAERFGKRLKLNYAPGRITEHLMTFSLAAIDSYRRAPKPRGSTNRSPADDVD